MYFIITPNFDPIQILQKTFIYKIAAGIKTVVDVGSYYWDKTNGNLILTVFGTVSELTSRLFNMFESQYSNFFK